MRCLFVSRTRDKRRVTLATTSYMLQSAPIVFALAQEEILCQPMYNLQKPSPQNCSSLQPEGTGTDRLVFKLDRLVFNSNPSIISNYALLRRRSSQSFYGAHVKAKITVLLSSIM